MVLLLLVGFNLLGYFPGRYEELERFVARVDELRRQVNPGKGPLA